MTDIIIVICVVIAILVLAYLDKQFEGAENQMLLMNPVIVMIAGFVGIGIGWYTIIVAGILFYANHRIYKWRINE